jgi:hypothetical protein
MYVTLNTTVERALTAYAKRGKLLSGPAGQCTYENTAPRREDCPIRALKILRY